VVLSQLIGTEDVAAGAVHPFIIQGYRQAVHPESPLPHTHPPCPSTPASTAASWHQVQVYPH
jgi:hypothetical protein